MIRQRTFQEAEKPSKLTLPSDMNSTSTYGEFAVTLGGVVKLPDNC
jgi:hypothetical protein